ncbi:hypothetical protein NFHSH190041_20270 [Shewanella sp. NFH-SH190041]|uniref:hypothetical protein n=1 Tax=Shewanella sp. NFH-SH190041 TaxID=2950245 RepID=UPI0021C4752B|nr:hypothetical protein [Shewanella sp. NFH-SH190041]BDM64575.1 hypothetical protein NFHSH190041_20270 [Shewanella sp. NFH-SH190041]
MIYQVTFHPLASSRQQKVVITVNAEQPDEAQSIATHRLATDFIPRCRRSRFKKKVSVVELAE